MKWTHKKLSQVATILMGQSPPGSTYNETGQGLPFFQGVKDFGARYPSERVYCTAPTRIAEEGDILFSVRAPIGSINRANQKCAIGRGLSAIRASTPSDTAFLEFLLRSMNRAWGRYESQGAIFGNARKRDLEDLDVLWPPDDVRGRITSILSPYDDLIENNRRRIQLLEQAARLLYREWFVHLRFPGHEHAKIKDGVPEGWEKVTVPEIIAINPKEAVIKGFDIRYVPMSSLSESDMTINASDTKVRQKATTVKFRNGDTLLARITPCLENGKTGYINFLAEGEVACGSTEFIVLRGKYVSSYFTYCLVRTYDFRENAIKSMIGSSGRQRVQISCFDEYSLGLPPKMLLQQFDEFASRCFEQIWCLMQQNRNLEKARDLLLPRLMNGEIAV